MELFLSATINSPFVVFDAAGEIFELEGAFVEDEFEGSFGAVGEVFAGAEG